MMLVVTVQYFHVNIIQWFRIVDKETRFNGTLVGNNWTYSVWTNTVKW